MMKNLFQNSKKYKISATFFWLYHWKNHWNRIRIDKVIDFNIRLFYAYNLVPSYSGLKSQTLHNDLNELLCRPFVTSSFKKGKLIVFKTYFRHLQSSEARGKWLCLLKINLSCNFEKKLFQNITFPRGRNVWSLNKASLWSLLNTTLPGKNRFIIGMTHTW